MMAIENMKEDNELTGVFIKATDGDGDECYLSVDGISRLYNFFGNLFVRHSTKGHEDGNYRIPDVTYEEGLKKFRKLTGFKFLDLSKM